MKPHFWKVHGYWFCGTSRHSMDWGLALTVKDAHAEFIKGGWYGVGFSKGTS